jgi:hypothetical protein
MYWHREKIFKRISLLSFYKIFISAYMESMLNGGKSIKTEHISVNNAPKNEK